MIKIIFLFLIALVSTSYNTGYKSKVIMVVLAHPDDETAVAQILAKCAREKNKVYLVLACDGRYGVEEHAGIPAGDSLAKIRRQESECASKVLGIEPPIFLGAHDGFGIVTGLDDYFRQTKKIKQDLIKKIKEVDPDLIITFGPDGDTGHPDHRAISDITTEVVLREGWYEKYPIYYIGWLKDKIVSIPQGNITSLNYLDKKYLNVRIKYSVEDRQKLFESLNCYKSQFTEADVKDWINAELKDSSLTFYFRQFKTDTKLKTGF